MEWKPEKYYYCPRCEVPFLGCIVGPGATHLLRCPNGCGETTTDKLRLVRKAEFEAIKPQLAEWLKDLPPTVFVGYDTLECETTILKVIPFGRKKENEV